MRKIDLKKIMVDQKEESKHISIRVPVSAVNFMKKYKISQTKLFMHALTEFTDYMGEDT